MTTQDMSKKLKSKLNRDVPLLESHLNPVRHLQNGTSQFTCQICINEN
jgi:hypothetical protein